MMTEVTLSILGAGVFVVALAATNGVAEPVSQSIVLLQKGNTAERREAVQTLARLGDQRAAPHLAAALRDDDALVRQLSEHALWTLWHQSGDPEVDAQFQTGLNAMQRGAFSEAVEIFSDVIERAPTFAEGYNKRATVYYLMREFEKSIADCDKTIELNPIHFGALSGAGLCYLGLRDLHNAKSYFERAVEVNPNLPQIQKYIEEIKQFFRDQSL